MKRIKFFLTGFMMLLTTMPWGVCLAKSVLTEVSGGNLPQSEYGNLRRKPVIKSPADCELEIYSISGFLKRLTLSAGITEINNLAPGLYIINGQKIIIN